MRKKPKYYRILFFTYTALLVVVAFLPINSTETVNNIFIISMRMDYILHFVLFLPWVFLLRMVTNKTFKTAPYKTLALIFLGVLFAFSTEFVQYFLSYRTFNINDLIANGLGVVLGAVVFFR
jgi:VanZ family protein